LVVDNHQSPTLDLRTQRRGVEQFFNLAHS
jgi:hypothetical protein